MKLNNSILFIFLWFPIGLQFGQGTKETIKKAKAEMRSDSTTAKIDSLSVVNDSLTSVVMGTVEELERQANQLPGKVAQLQNSVDRLVKQAPDTVATVRVKTKYVPVPDKEDYWKRQKEYTDSLKQAKQDSINQAWKDRSFFRKLLGIHPKKHKR